MDIQKIELSQLATMFASEIDDLAAIDAAYAPDSLERDAYEAAVARGFRPGTYMFDQFYGWSMDMMKSASR